MTMETSLRFDSGKKHLKLFAKEKFSNDDNYVLTVRRLVRAVALPALALAMAMGGCDVDNYMDPSQTGYFETTPTTMPVLSRLDVIEKKVDRWGGPVVAATTEDLTPNDVEYRLEPGDIVRIEIYELVAAGQTSVNVRRVEQNGTVRLPTLYDVRAGGLTIQELQEEIEERLRDPCPPRHGVTSSPPRSCRASTFAPLAIS